MNSLKLFDRKLSAGDCSFTFYAIRFIEFYRSKIGDEDNLNEMALQLYRTVSQFLLILICSFLLLFTKIRSSSQIVDFYGTAAGSIISGRGDAARRY